MDVKQPEFWIYIDNSNLFIEGQRYYASIKNWRVQRDPRFRIDYGKLINILVNNNYKFIKGIQLYGSEPPPLDTLWKRLEQIGIPVNKFRRNAKNKEKEVDQALVVHATRCSCQNRDKSGIGTFIFLTGDRDMTTCLEGVLDDGFKVVVVSYKKALAQNLITLSQNNPNMTIKYLNDIIQSCCYMSLEWVKKLPCEKSFVILFNTNFKIDQFKIKEITYRMAEFFRLPCMYKYNETLKFLGLVIVWTENGPSSIEFDELYRECKPKIENYLSDRFGKHSFTEVLDTVSFKYRLPKDTAWEWVIDLDINDDRGDNGVNDESERIELKSADLIGENSIKDLEDIDCFSSLNNNQIKINNKINNLTQTNQNECATAAASVMAFKSFENEARLHDNKLSNNYHQLTNGSINDDWQVAGLKPNAKKPQKYSDYCKNGYTCTNGNKCSYKHTEEEKKVFKQFGGTGVRNYKREKCNKQWCPHKNETILCAFAHDLKEARCYNCIPRKGLLGDHWMSDCPKASQRAK